MDRIPSVADTPKTKVREEVDPNSPADILPYPTKVNSDEVRFEGPGDQYRPAKYEHNYALQKLSQTKKK